MLRLARPLVMSTAILAAQTLAPAQQTSPGPASGALSGVVLNAGTTTPVPHALVELRAANGATGADASMRVLTDASGRWAFRNVPRGDVMVHATAYGYLAGTLGQRVPGGPAAAVGVEDARPLDTLEIQLWRHAVITGTLRDEHGDPLVGTPVRALRRDAPGSRLRHTEVASATTNDLGQYRFAGLLPGEYVIAGGISTINNTSAGASEVLTRQLKERPGDAQLTQARLSNSGIFNPNAPFMAVGGGRILSATLSSFDLMPPAVAAGERWRVMQRTFYPAARGASTAEGVVVRSGETKTGIDITLPAVPASSIRGTVVGPAGPEPLIGVQLLHALDDAYGGSSILGEVAIAAAPTDGAGRFHFAGVPPGRYRLHVLRMPRTSMPQSAISEGSVWATESIDVGGTDIDNLTLTVVTGFRVLGRVVAADGRRLPDAQRVAITLSLADGRPFPGHLPGKCDAEGAFQTIEYPAGRYFVDVTGLPPGWSVKSVTAGGRETATRPVELRDRYLSDVVVTVTDASTTLAGVARTAAGSPDRQATIAMFPAEHAEWLAQGSHPRVTREVRTGQDGSFKVIGLPAGDYLVASVSDDDVMRWRTTRVISALVKTATRVTLAEGSESSVIVTTGRR